MKQDDPLPGISVFRMRSWADAIFLVTLFFTTTQLYRVVAVVLNIQPFALVSITITAICILYVISAGEHRLLVGRDSFIFTLAIFAYPFFSFLFAREMQLRDPFLQGHYLLLFFATAYYFRRDRNVGALFAASLLASFVAMIVGLIAPAKFIEMAQMASAKYDYLGRGSGLFLQPNLLAYNLTLLLILFYLASGANQARTFLSVAAVSFLAVLLTGSRGGIIASGLFLAGIAIAGRKFTVKSKLTSVFFILSVLGVGAYVAAPEINELGINISTYAARLDSLFSASISTDRSVSTRFQYQAEFIDRIGHEPLAGHGIGSVEHLREAGALSGAAHNQILDTMLEYGVLGLVLVILGAWRLHVLIGRLPIRRPRAVSWVILTTLLLVALGTNMLFSMQNFYILLGYLVGTASRRSRPPQRALPRNAFAAETMR